MEVNSSNSSKRPACDNCKERKTKCDRGFPCSSCVAAELECRITRRPPEKRQRVLISARYDEAMESVDRSLQDISQRLQKLLRNSEQAQESPKGSPAALIGSHLSDVSRTSEGYRGDSSFTAHVQSVTDALRDAAANLEFNLNDTNFSATTRAPQMIQEAAEGEEITPGVSDVHSSFQVKYPELEGKSLPPLETVLQLLRLARLEKQRFFIDVPIFDEHEFGELCQRVYFAISDYSLSAWAIVNTGLFYLFIGLAEQDYPKVGVTSSDIQANSQLSSANVEAAIQSLRLCQDPSIEGCQALALLASFCMKTGRSAIARSLIASASGMCIDLGWHRLLPDPERSSLLKERRIFWHVYIMDKYMAFTFGRTPSIHQFDVTTERPSFHDLPGVPIYPYTGFFEFAIIVGDMHVQLFSAAAQRGSQQTRAEHAKAFAARLIQVDSNLKQV